MYRDATKKITIGNRTIGGGNEIAIQSMTNTKTEDVEATVSQIIELEKAGCELVRLSIPNEESATALKEIKPSATCTQIIIHPVYLTQILRFSITRHTLHL